MYEPSIDRPSPAQRLRALGEALELAPTHIVSLLVVASCASAGLVLLWWTAGPGNLGVAPEVPVGAALSEPTLVAGVASAPPEPVVVHVSGAVDSPGVRTLAGGARVDDAVRAAGGATGSARTELLNLARVLRDGEQIHVPDASEAAIAAPGPGASGPGAGGLGASGSAASGPAGLLDINRATPAELEDLPGVGPVLAERIVTQRASAGGFRAVEDLQAVPGIGDKTYAGLKDLVTV